MSLLSKDVQKRRLFIRRLKVLGFALGFIFLALSLRIAQWTLFRWRHYRELARDNYIHPQRLQAPRGRIFSRDGHILAANRMTYSIWVSPFRVTDEQVHRTVEFLEDHLNRDFSDKEEEALSLRPSWKRNLFARNLPLESAAAILERQWDLPGLRIARDYKRYYPAGEECAHILGYLSRISSRKMKEALASGYSRDDLIGIAGIERQYENLLRGKPGEDLVKRDARGRYIETLNTRAAIPGDDRHVRVDGDLQRDGTYKRGGRDGVVIIMSPGSGAVYAMVSYPGYNSNNPAAPSRPSRPVSYLNKAIQDNYPPASTFKMVTAVAGLRDGFSPSREYLCEGYYYLKGWDNPFKCEHTAGHGHLNLREALMHSCNIYFYRLALDMGARRLLFTAQDFGYGLETGIDLPFEVDGNLPVERAGSMPPGNLMHICIGQGQNSAAPLQVINSYCIFANDGISVKPHLLDQRRSAEGEETVFRPERTRIPMSPADRRAVLEGLKAVVNSPDGTASSAEFPEEWKVAGKTGTGERTGKEDDAWFVCFAPYDDPEIAVLVFLEEGGFGGSNAAPLAREMLDYYFKNRRRFGKE